MPFDGPFASFEIVPSSLLDEELSKSPMSTKISLSKDTMDLKQSQSFQTLKTSQESPKL